MTPDHASTHRPVRYVSSEEDSDRWNRFPFRDGDIVVSTRSKSGTTWMQQICLSLVHGTTKLPATLAELSPWVDWLTTPEAELFARLEAQPGRRVVKTHTPLDGVVLDDRATYVVVVRHPLDLAVSLYHQGDNIDRERVAELTGQPYRARRPRPSLHDWLLEWATEDVDRMVQMDSLQGVVHHASDAWVRRSEANVVLVRYEDLIADLEGRMRGLADVLAIDVPDEAWPDLVAGARLDSMRAAAVETAPGRGVLKDPAAFFKRGRPGAGREVLSRSDVEAFEARVRELAEPEVCVLLGVPA